MTERILVYDDLEGRSAADLLLQIARDRQAVEERAELAKATLEQPEAPTFRGLAALGQA
jgi:hypothetical protein